MVLVVVVVVLYHEYNSKKVILRVKVKVAIGRIRKMEV